MATIAELKSWFETLDTPTQAQFGALIDSMMHRTDGAKLALDRIEGLQGLLDSFVTSTQFADEIADVEGGTYDDSDIHAKTDANAANITTIQTLLASDNIAIQSEVDLNTDFREKFEDEVTIFTGGDAALDSTIDFKSNKLIIKNDNDSSIEIDENVEVESGNNIDIEAVNKIKIMAQTEIDISSDEAFITSDELDLLGKHRLKLASDDYIKINTQTNSIEFYNDPLLGIKINGGAHYSSDESAAAAIANFGNLAVPSYQFTKDYADSLTLNIPELSATEHTNNAGYTVIGNFDKTPQVFLLKLNSFRGSGIHSAETLYLNGDNYPMTDHKGDDFKTGSVNAIGEVSYLCYISEGKVKFVDVGQSTGSSYDDTAIQAQVDNNTSEITKSKGGIINITNDVFYSSSLTNKTIRLNSITGKTFTFSDDILADTELCYFRAVDAGFLTLVGDTGITINDPDNLNGTQRNLCLQKIITNEYDLI